MKKLFLLLFFSSLALQAQQVTQFASQSGMMIFTKEKEPDTYTGTPYVEKDFQAGIIHDDKGRSQGALMRYNAIEDVVVLKLNKKDPDVYVLPKLPNITYELPDYTYFIENIETDNGNKESYFARYYKSNKVSFIGIPDVDVIQPQKARTGYEKDKPAHIDVDMNYYISLNDGIYKEVRLKEKDFKELLGNSERMKKYFDDHKIKDEKDVVDLLKFYDQNS